MSKPAGFLNWNCPMHRFVGRRALVTGGAKGIGRAISRRIAAEGGIVTIVDLNGELGARTVADIVESGGSATFVAGDVTTDATINRAIETAVGGSGVLDVLINNAQYFAPLTPLELVTVEDWDRSDATGPKAAFRLMKRAFPYLKKSGHAAVVNMTSGAALAGIKYNGPYAAAKGAMLALTKVAANDWGKYNIRVNAVSPFAMSEDGRKVGTHSDVYSQLAAASPLGRHADFDREIAPSIAYLASDDAGAVTGTVLYVDSGVTELSAVDFSKAPGAVQL